MPVEHSPRPPTHPARGQSSQRQNADMNPTRFSGDPYKPLAPYVSQRYDDTRYDDGRSYADYQTDEYCSPLSLW
jgi:hypothetical protein